MFRWQKKRQKNDNNNDTDESEELDNNDGIDGEEVGGNSEMMEWGMKVELDLWRWIEMKECRCEIADKYFNNPPERRHEYFHLLLLLTVELTTI